MSKSFILIAFFLVLNNILSQQKPKLVTAHFSEKELKIDGVLDESEWALADKASDFVQLFPENGEPISNDFDSDVKVIYTPSSLVIGAILKDPNPEKILRQLGERDDLDKNVSTFVMFLNPYADGQNDFFFAVTAAGVQADAKSTENDYDFNWDAVWNSSVKITDEGWAVEMEIPYSAIRFPKNSENNWAINFQRDIRRERTSYTWNWIDNNNGKQQLYNGELAGLKNIKAPFRLSLLPYNTSYLGVSEGSTNFENNIGLDIKWGINESYTLDMTLIPDFGQAAFDDTVVNLGPFEVQYDERRPFFTEGIELFNKGNLFYSRRIGNTPSKNGDVEDLLGENEEIESNPTSTDVLNAWKISGRGKGGLGIGIFNGITQKAEAVIKNTSTDERRTMVTEPVSNYNILVLDKQFNGNSSVTFINTNVTRFGDFKDANVTGLLYDVNNKANSFNFSGHLKGSFTNDPTDGKKNGLEGKFGVFKISGEWRYGYVNNWRNSDYDANDLAFANRTNYFTNFAFIRHQILKPNKLFNFQRNEIRFRQNFQMDPIVFTSSFRGFYRGRFAFKSFDFIGIDVEQDFMDVKNYYEPRRSGMYLVYPKATELGVFYSSDFRKAFAIEGGVGFKNYSKHSPSDRFDKGIDVSFRYRFNDKFNTSLGIEIDDRKGDFGYVDETESTVYIGKRDIDELEFSLRGDYTFNNKATLQLVSRLYNFNVKYDSFYEMEGRANLIPTSYNEENDYHNWIWNMDLRFRWNFTPGSDLIILYRNNAFTEKTLLNNTYESLITNTFENPINHLFSIKFTYFLDFPEVKKWFKKS